MRELRTCIEYWERELTNKNDQNTVKRLWPYMVVWEIYCWSWRHPLCEERRHVFNCNSKWTLNWSWVLFNLWFLFTRKLATYQNPCIILKTIRKCVYSQTNKESNIKKCNKSKRTIDFTETFHILQMKRQKAVIDYPNKRLDILRLAVITLSPML